MRRLPPLNAVKSFECAARTGSYVAAAAELQVTPAAVSQQVRQLEEFLRLKLFVRHNNRIVLTDAGQAIFAGVSPALEDIAAIAQRVMTGSSRSKLVVSVIPSLAECWFMPALAAFIAERPGMRIDLRVESEPFDFASGEIDLRITYGVAHGSGLRMIPLFRDVVQPLCAPELAAQLSLQDADDSQFIHTSWGPDFASHPSWNDWFAHHLPVRRVDSSKGHRAGSSQFAIDFARRGLGIALGQNALASEDLRAGRLVTMASGTLPLGEDYFAVIPGAKLRKTGVAPLIEFLKTRAPRR